MKITSSITATALVAIVSFALSGCGGGESYTGPGLVPCEGVVTLDGQPLADATLSMSNGISTCSATTDAEGKFVMTTAQGPKAHKGAQQAQYKVSVRKVEEQDLGVPDLAEGASDEERAAHEEKMMEAQEKAGPPKSLIPEKYTSPATSGLTIDLTEGGKTDIALELTGG